MPLPATVSRLTPTTRSALRLPNNVFLYLYVFDFNSYLERKNPFAVLKAFTNAFPSDDMSVGLVLKTMNSDPKNPTWKRFLKLCKSDRRISVIETTMDRGTILGLIACCDAYVSLHRSEGFGRTLAEAMLLGKPVIGTNFSGNVDFLTQKIGFPVKWHRRDVKVGEYPFIRDLDRAWWAEPDVHHASQQMLRVRPRTNDRFSNKILQFAKTVFEPDVIGKKMQMRLGLNFNNDTRADTENR